MAQAMEEAPPVNAQEQPQAARGVDLMTAREKQLLDLQVAHQKMLAIMQELPLAVKHKHALCFFKTLASKAQQVKVECMACGYTVTSTGSTRPLKHLVVCALVPKEVKTLFVNLHSMTESRKVQKRQNEALVKDEADVMANEHAVKQAKLRQQGVRAGLKSLEAAEADLAIARFFYANGLSFAAASGGQDSYYRAMIKKIQAAPCGYIPPSRNKLGGPLLDECHEWMWKKIGERDPDGMRAMRFCSAYVSDGWDSCDNLPLINSAFITGNDGGVYWRSVDTTGKEKNAEYCAALMIADIYEFGPDKVILVITDTCSTMRKCWSIVMDEFPWMMVLPCQAHVISLLMKDLGKSKQV